MVLSVVSSRQSALLKHHISVILYIVLPAIVDDRLLVISQQTEMVLHRVEFKPFLRKLFLGSFYVRETFDVPMEPILPALMSSTASARFSRRLFGTWIQ